MNKDTRVSKRTALSERSEILFGETAVQQLVNRLAAEICSAYDEPFTMIGVLNAAAPLMFDLIRAMPESIREGVSYDFVQATSQNGTMSTGQAKIVGPNKIDLRDRHIVVVEGIVASGLTIHTLIPRLAARKPRSIRVCALLSQEAQRSHNVPVDFVGAEIDEGFVIGYGLDLDNDYRALPYIAVLN